METYRTLKRLVTNILGTGKRAAPRRLVSGHDLQRWFHLTEGRLIGELREKLYDEQLAGTFTTRRAAKTVAKSLLP